MHCLLTKVQYYVIAQLEEVYFLISFAFLCTERRNNTKSLIPKQIHPPFVKICCSEFITQQLKNYD